MQTNSGSGTDAKLDDAVLASFLEKYKTESMIHGQPRNLLPLHPDITPTDLLNHHPCSIDNGYVVPFNASFPFGGIVDGIGREQGRWMCSTLIHGFMPLRIKRFSHRATLGQKVYVYKTSPSVVYSLSGHAGAEIGVLARIDNPGSGEVIVSFSLQHLPRP
jgi:hypothetical protein